MPLRIKIHRGANQIGGCITEISTNTTKILIDLGKNLPSEAGDKDSLANNESVAEVTKGCTAIFYTHLHGDHIDLFEYVPDDINIPQYIGEGAREVLLRKYETLSKYKSHNDKEKALNKIKNNFKGYTAGHAKKIGDISVTPYFTSHSAFDSYMLLIEAEGLRILHTGDFRSHSYLGKTVNIIIEKIKSVDVLITEGTMLSRMNETVITENDLKNRAIEIMKQYKYVFVMTSSTDMERLATFNAATENFPGRLFLRDEYQNDILNIFTAWSGKHSKLFDFGEKPYYNPKNEKTNTYIKEHGFTLPIRVSMQRMVDEMFNILDDPQNTLLIYSMWNGYYVDPSKPYYSEKVSLMRSKFQNCIDLHTSGHADSKTLEFLCKSLNPRLAIIPIHKDKHSDFSKLNIPDELKNKIVTDSFVTENLIVESH